MAYSDVEKHAKAATRSAQSAKFATNDEAVQSLADAVGHLGKALEELAGVLRRTER